MGLAWQRIRVGDSHLNLLHAERMILGFSEKGIGVKELIRHLGEPVWTELKQTHSSTIHHADRVGRGMAGDGLILTERRRLAVIKTADCLPLFFWDDASPCGGIVHIGWRGLAHGIERTLVESLQVIGRRPDRFRFFMGPVIESRCYPVGQEVTEAFANHPFKNDLIGRSLSGQTTLDISAGVRCALLQSGVPHTRIAESGLCTFCERDRFPSFRREGKSASRIYNFMMFT